MTKRKNLTAKPPQSTAYYSESNDPTEIAKAMAENVDGWADMPECVKAEIVALNIATNAMPNGPRMSVTENMVYQNTKNPQLHTMRLVKALGSSSGEFVTYLLDRLATTLKASGGLTAESLNGALAFVNSFNPSNEAEAMLGVQMFLTNDAAMRSLRTANAADWVDTTAQFTNLSVKLMRTFAMQAEAMAKLQRGGVQTVKHIHVDNRGGQAVIADQVHQGGKMENSKINLMNLAPRCLAKTRRGSLCHCPAMRGKKRCRIHGGASPGAPKGNKNALRHGHYTNEAGSMAGQMRRLITSSREMLAGF